MSSAEVLFFSPSMLSFNKVDPLIYNNSRLLFNTEQTTALLYLWIVPPVFL